MGLVGTSKVFYVALVTSACAHALCVFGLPRLARTPSPPLPSQTLVFVAAPPSAVPELPAPFTPIPPTGGRLPEQVAVPQPHTSPPGVVGTAARMMHPPALRGQPSQPPTIRQTPDVSTIPAIVDLSNLVAHRDQHPEYLAYFRDVRKRIRHYAQRYYRDGATPGKAYITFTLTGAGQLDALALDTARSSPDISIQRASLRSIEEAAPFPLFPPTLTQPAISFRIVIEYNMR